MVKNLVKTPEEIKNIRRSGKILTTVLDELEAAVKAGITTASLNELAESHTRELGGIPAFLHYNNFPASLCVSINNEIVHGIPSERKLQTGDLVGLDYGVNYGGMITDAARTISVGKPTAAGKKLLEGCYNALQAALDVVRDDVRVGDIGATIEEKLHHAGVMPIYSLVGHGVGHNVHEDPVIPNYGTHGTGQRLKAGMTIAIEPIAAASTHDLYLAEDGWTYMTRDGSLSAQFEATVLVTETGCEVLAS